MSIGTESQTDSVYLSSSISSLHRPKKSSSEISKTYKHASQLYLTRRLIECYEALQPVIRPPYQQGKARENGHSTSEDEAKPRAPIASASTSQRIKTWSLYATLLNAIVELGDEDGKHDFGSKLYREIVRNVQSGEVWEQVIRDGYLGREASVDAEVVYNLSNLLLGQAQDQTVNQTRLEIYLSSAPQGSIDFSSAFQDGSKMRTSSGMDTPRDLNSRIKILELFVLHVLPANNEWDYAKSFVTNSDILDDERREAFLQTLMELQEAKEQEEAEAAAEQDLVGFAEETEDEEVQNEKIQMNENDDEQAAIDETSDNQRPSRNSHHRSSSEVDYGIDDDLLKSRSPPPQSTTTTKASSTTYATSASVSTRTQSPTPSAPPPSVAPSRPATSPSPTPTTSSAPAPTSRKPSVPVAPTRKGVNGVPRKQGSNNSNKNSSSGSSQGFGKIIRIITNLTSAIASSLTRNPTQVFRTLMFLFAFLAVLARRDVRERLKNMLGQGWTKVRQTAGMGVRVSYV